LNARRDQNPRIEWPEIPAETPYLASYRERAVCKGWVVELVGLKLVTHQPVIEPVSSVEPGTEFCDAETGAQLSLFRPAETNLETREGAKSPHSGATNAKTLTGV
jgi:hypothetical protein